MKMTDIAAGAVLACLLTANVRANVKFYVKDHLGSIRTVIDQQSGLVVEAHSYYPHGEHMEGKSSLAGADKTTEGFSGKELDEDGEDPALGVKGLSLQYFGARYYDVDIIRWTTKDPLNEFHTPYSYVGGNPVSLVDPTGMSSVHTSDNAETSPDNGQDDKSGDSNSGGDDTYTGERSGSGGSSLGGQDVNQILEQYESPNNNEMASAEADNVNVEKIAAKVEKDGGDDDDKEQEYYYDEHGIKVININREIKRSSVKLSVLPQGNLWTGDAMFAGEKDSYSSVGILFSQSFLSLEVGAVPEKGDKTAALNVGILTCGWNWSVKDMYGQPSTYVGVSLGTGVSTPISATGTGWGKNGTKPVTTTIPVLSPAP